MHHYYFILYAIKLTMTLYIPPHCLSIPQTILPIPMSISIILFAVIVGIAVVLLLLSLSLSSSSCHHRHCCFCHLIGHSCHQRRHCRCCHHTGFRHPLLFVCLSFFRLLIHHESFVQSLFVCSLLVFSFMHCYNRLEVSSARPSRRHRTSCLPYWPSHHCACTTIVFAVAITFISTRLIAV